MQEMTVNYCTAILSLHLDNISTRSVLLAIELCWVSYFLFICCSFVVFLLCLAICFFYGKHRSYRLFLCLFWLSFFLIKTSGIKQDLS